MKPTELTIMALLCASLTAFAGIGTVSVGTTETQVLPAKADRRWLLFQNNSVGDIYVKMDGSTNQLTTSNGIKISPNGGTFVIAASSGANPSRNLIKAISALGTNTLTYQEGNEN